MKKKSVCLCLSLLLSALSVCGCRYRGEARAEVESEIAALREENIARAENLEAQASPEEPAAGSSEISAEAEPVKAASKRDWDGITSSQYTLIGDRYYYYVKAVPKVTVSTPAPKVKKISGSNAGRDYRGKDRGE